MFNVDTEDKRNAHSNFSFQNATEGKIMCDINGTVHENTLEKKFQLMFETFYRSFTIQSVSSDVPMKR